MTVIDFREQREARRRAEREKYNAEMDRQLEQIQRVADLLMPLCEQMMAEEKKRRRQPRCESPGCWCTEISLHPVQGRTADEHGALVRLCERHVGMIRAGRLRVLAAADDFLIWQLSAGHGIPPHHQLKWPRRRRRRSPRW